MLLTPGSILKLAMRCCVFGKTLFPIGAEQSHCGAQPDEIHANRTQKGDLHYRGWTDAKCLVINRFINVVEYA